MELHLTATEVTCHMGSHSVTCHSTQVNTARLNPSQTGQIHHGLPEFIISCIKAKYLAQR